MGHVVGFYLSQKRFYLVTIQPYFKDEGGNPVGHMSTGVSEYLNSNCISLDYSAYNFTPCFLGFTINVSRVGWCQQGHPWLKFQLIQQDLRKLCTARHFQKCLVIAVYKQIHIINWRVFVLCIHYFYFLMVAIFR